MSPSPNFTTIQTPRLFLRPITLEDAADIFLIRSDSETLRYSNRKADTSISQTRDWIQERLNGHVSFSFAVELAPDPSADSPPEEVVVVVQGPKVIGHIGSSSRAGLPNIGYFYNKVYWGKGYATEALEAVVDAYWREYPSGFPGLKEEDRNILRGGTDWDNSASQAVLKKCGFELYDKAEYVDLEGKINTCHRYRLRRPEKS